MRAGNRQEEKPSDGRLWKHDALALLYTVLAAYVLIACLLFQFNGSSYFFGIDKPSTVIGRVGEIIASLLHTYMGYCSLVVVLWCCGYALFLWRYEGSEEKRSSPPAFFGALLGFFVTACCLAYLFWGDGGLLGRWFMRLPMDKIGPIGSGIAAAGLFLFFLAIITAHSVPELITRTIRTAFHGSIRSGKMLYTSGRFSHRMLVAIYNYFEARRLAREEALNVTPVWEKSLFDDGAPPRKKRRPARQPKEEDLEEEEEEEEDPDEYDEEDFLDDDDDDDEDEEYDEGEYSHVVVMRRDPPGGKTSSKNRKTAAAPKRVKEYVFPEASLLPRSGPSETMEDDEELLAISRQIESKLRDFSVHGRVTEVHPGPVVTLFEFEPAPGVKVGKIAALQDDLSMSLKASSLRIVAPIPKKGTVGIEVPNKHRDIVRLGDLIECEPFLEADSILTVPIGKDTYGEPVVADIATMPHLLMAGATGTGKSVLINNVLVSLLYRATPEELGLILIDPKVLELSVYDGIPHLRVPVVTVPKQARAVLDWAAREMDRRYRLMQRFGVRSIDGYNKLVKGEGDDRRNIPEDVIRLAEDEIVQEGTAAGSSDMEECRDVTIAEQLQPLPKIVIVIDELADLMLTVGREIEELITRLAQKARAAGLHLIVATQRPSVDVITGLIKANFPARLSFRVASRIDSRTILDCMGAEKLLGKGDMLFMLPGGVSLKRVHGAFVSDAEVKRVIDEVKKNGPPAYDERIMAICEKALSDGDQGKDGGGDEEYDAFYDKAVQLVIDKGQASTSMIQRAFRIGYNRAARIIEVMEQEGIIGPMDGVKPREVLLPNRKEG